MLRNTVEFELNGKVIGFRTGMMALSVAAAECGAKTTQEFFRRLADQDLLACQALFYGAAYQYAQWKGQKVDFNATQVSEWIEDVGEEKAEGLTAKLLESYIPKNSRPPHQAGEIQPSMIGNSPQ